MNQHRDPEASLHQEFKAKLDQEWKQRAREDGLATNCARLLQVAFAEHTRSYHQPLQASQVCSDVDSCCLVFSILLDIGHPELLDVFHAAKIFDHHLSSADYYYPELRARLAADSYDPGEISKIIADFDRNKRSYCVAEFKQRSDSFHNGKWILPICKKERINNKGGTAAIWQILVKSEVLPEELKAAVPHAETDDPEFGLCYQFALKEYLPENEDSYKWEIQAFQLFLGQKGMVQYLGDFTYDTHEDPQSRTFNLLLEYGEQDLDEFFFQDRPPRLALEIHQFWSDLFEVAKALARVHNLRLRYDDGRDQHIRGWHADVKPDNILRVRGSFVLADFGFARFQKKVAESNGEPALETLTGGTDTYGAPETDAIRRRQVTLRSVMQTIDIWSFGCVLSTAASWVVFGFQGIRDYEAVRRKATAALQEMGKTGPSANDAFHDGTKILPEILTWHTYLRENLRKSDVTTESILTLIEEHMLLEDPGSRIDSAMLCSKLTEIVKLSEAEVQAKSSPLTAVLNELLTDIDAYATGPDLASQPTGPHNAIESTSRNSLLAPSKSSQLQISPGNLSAKQAKKSERINAIPHLKTTVRNTRRFGVPSQHLDAPLVPPQRPLSLWSPPNPILYVTEAPESSPFPMTESPQDVSAVLEAGSAAIFPGHQGHTDATWNAHGLSLNLVNDPESEVLPTNPVRPLLDPVQRQDQPQLDSHPSVSKASSSQDHLAVSLERRGNGKATADTSKPTTLVNTTSTSVPDPFNDPRTSTEIPTSKHAVNGKEHADRASLHSHQRTMSARSTSLRTQLHDPYSNRELDIVQARIQLDAKLETTSHKLRNRFGKIKVDPLLENYIKDRDIAFVVDNGTTMGAHWQDVVFTLETLYLKLDGLDENGVDLIFTDRAKSACNKNELKKSSGRTLLVRSMYDAQPAAPDAIEERVRTNMKEVLSPIFQRYLTSRQNKRMTLIVLTDGVWEGSTTEEGVAEKIRDFYQSWHGKSRVVEDRWFSIQFVSFGDNATALRRLQVLDDDMAAIYKIPDFVDTEPWTGSVKKMITGSLSDEDDARSGGERSPPAKTPASPNDLGRNGTVKSSRFSTMFSGRKSQAGPS
ncbi:hypothetical protein FKW77_004200 [Venturia effusa]|uniref:non-specific serine/threonine protein kinase n=1 Tax=Venturia effusa TaxID=50376 RepID=A0A517LH08_9PEZI|nr:hypothetical protein FKW77_004200 [Venturia effusa]